MLVSLSGCGCYLDLSPGNNKGTLCSSVWHQRPTWTGKEGGGKELAPRKGGVGESKKKKKKRQRQAGMVRNKEEKNKDLAKEKLRERAREESWVQIESAHAGR